MSMFCYQCQETAKGTGCEIKGVCGKNEEVAKLQDLLIYTCIMCYIGTQYTAISAYTRHGNITN